MLLLVFLLPALAYAQISIFIDVSQEEDVKIDLKGKAVHDVTEHAKQMFDLTESQIKELLHTSLDGLYHTHYFDWRIKEEMTFNSIVRDVLMTIKPIMATLQDLDSTPAVLLHHQFENNGTTTAEYAMDLKREVTTNVTHTTDATQDLRTLAGSTTSVNIIIANIIGGTTSFDYKWGTTGTISSDSGKIGSIYTIPSKGLSVEPYHMMEASLMASHNSMKIQVLYELDISGQIEIRGKRRDESPALYYVAPLSTVSKRISAGRVQVTETLEIDFYTDFDTDFVATPIDVSQDATVSEDLDIVEETRK